MFFSLNGTSSLILMRTLAITMAALRLESQNRSKNGAECALHLSEFVHKAGQDKDNTGIHQPESAHW